MLKCGKNANVIFSSFFFELNLIIIMQKINIYIYNITKYKKRTKTVHNQSIKENLILTAVEIFFSEKEKNLFLNKIFFIHI